jgi:hypothetical protein
MIIFSLEESIWLLTTMREVGNFGAALSYHLGEVGRDPAIIRHMVRL